MEKRLASLALILLSLTSKAQFDFMPKISQSHLDDVNHIALSYIISSTLTAGINDLTPLSRTQSALLAGGVSLTIGLGKELYDKSKGKMFSKTDIISDVIGTTVGCITIRICFEKPNKWKPRNNISF